MKKAQKIIVTVVIALTTATAFANTFDDEQIWSMGFYTPWGDPQLPVADIEWGGLTHIAQVAALPQSDGTLEMTFSDKHDSVTKSLIANAHANNVKVLLCVWQNGPGDFYGAASNYRTALITNIMELVNTYEYDGVDLDWETNFNDSVMTLLLDDLREQLGVKLLTADVGVTTYKYWGTTHAALDRVNVMTYDVCGSWDPYSWYNSALYSPSPGNQVWSIHLARQRFSGAGVPLFKLNIGIPFYGYRMTGISGPRQTGSYTKTAINYNGIVSQYDLSNANWDNEAKVPWLPLTNEYITYENERSVTEKVDYVESEGLGGWIIWALDSDYSPDKTNKNPLLNAIKKAMGVSSNTRITEKNDDPIINVSSNSINFDLVTTTRVTIKLYDIWGKVIRDINMGMLNSGNYSISMERESLSRGLYIVSMSIGEKSIQTKMLIR
jgi:chitinase